MILLTYTHGEHELLFRPPPTTADVLDWTVWIACMEDLAQQLHCAWQWAAQWVEDENSKTLGEKLGTVEATIALCNAIASSAGVPPSIIEDLGKLLDRQNKIDPEWKPKKPCGCSKCRRDIDVGQPCLYDGLDPRANSAAASIIDTADPSAPLYVSQIRAELDAAENRRIRFERDKKKDKDDTVSGLCETSARIYGSSGVH